MLSDYFLRNFIVTLFWVLFSTAGLAANELPKFDCLIEPWQRVDISFAAQGILSSVKVEQSDLVTAGQRLGALESGLEQATVDLRSARSDMIEEVRSASINYQFSQRNVKRLEGLYKKKAIPFNKLDEARTELDINRHRLQQAKDNNRLAELELVMAQQVLSRRSIFSPIDGVVVKRYKTLGEYVEDEPVLQLAQLDPLRVQVLVPVSMFGQISPGMDARVMPEAPMDQRSRVARVVVVDKLVDVASGTFSVQLELKNTDYQLPGGLKCEIRFSL